MVHLSLTFVDENDNQLAIPSMIINDYPYIPRKDDFFKINLKWGGVDRFEDPYADEVQDLTEIFNSDVFVVVRAVFDYALKTKDDWNLVELVIKNTEKINRDFYNKIYVTPYKKEVE